MKKRRLLALVLATVMVFAMFAGCAKKDEPTPPTEGGDTTTPVTPPTEVDGMLKMGLSGISGVFNPIMNDGVYDGYVCDLIFEHLVGNNKAGEMIPELATWDLSEDKLTYTFTLKDGIKFSDGTPMTTADVEFTYRTMAIPEYNGPRPYAVATLKGYTAFNKGETKDFPGIKVIDEKTIAFTFEEGTAAPANVECFVYGILSKDYYAFTTWEEFLALNEKPMGSGVMVFDSYAPKQSVKLMKNENYWDAATAIKFEGLLMSEVPDESLLSALQTNQVDFAQLGLSKENLTALEGMENCNMANYLGNGYTYMQFNCTIPQLQDVKVRQALLYALDRKSFIEAEYGEMASVGMAPISPSSWAFPADQSALNAYDFDMDKAKALMDEAGWVEGKDGIREKDGQKMKLRWLVYTDSSWPGVLSGMAADTWKQLGVDLEIQLMDFATVQARTGDPAPGEKDFDIYTMGFSLSIDPDPTGALFDADAYTAGGFNCSGFRDDRSQELMKKGKTEFDNEKRKPIYEEWAKLQNELVPTVLVAYRNEIWGINKRISGMELDTYQTFVQCIKNITLS